MSADVSITYLKDQVVMKAGEKVYSLSGNMVSQVVTRLLPLLSGRWTLNEICLTASATEQSVIHEVVNVLYSSGLLTDADKVESSPEGVRSTSLTPYSARREVLVTNPERDRSVKEDDAIFVTGDPELSRVLHRAFASAGKALATITPRNTCGHSQQSGRTIVCVDKMRNNEPVMLDRDTDDWILFAVCGQYLIIGPPSSISQHGLLHLLQVYSPNTLVSVTPRDYELGVRLGSKLLVQAFLDTECNEDDHLVQCVYELDMLTLSVTKRPCPDLLELVPKGTVVEQLSISPGEIWDHMHNALVDFKTGLILGLDEADLIQQPHHISLAKWRPYQSGDTRYVLETDNNIRDSRGRALCTVLEEAAAIRVPEFIAKGTLPPLWSNRPELLFTSAFRGELITAISFFRTLSQYAAAHGSWSALKIPEGMIHGRAALTWAYLEDTAAIERVRVSKHDRFSTSGCEVLRFEYDHFPVSIVSGEQSAELWAIGMSDVWMHVTLLNSFGSAAVPTTVYRSTRTNSESQVRAKQALIEYLHLQFLTGDILLSTTDNGPFLHLTCGLILLEDRS